MVRIKQDDRQQVLSQSRRKLLDAATEEFALHGYELANINTISLKAGFAKGTIYNYFPSKQALLFALIDDIAADHLQTLRAEIQTVEEPEQCLISFFKAGFDFITNHRQRAKVMIDTVNSSSRDQKLYCFQAYQPVFQLFATEILIPGMDQGIFRRAEPLPTTILLMTIYMGAASQVDEQGFPYLDPTMVTELILHGLRATQEGSNL